MKKLLVIFFALTIQVIAQDSSSVQDVLMTGILSFDSRNIIAQNATEQPNMMQAEVTGKKSPLLAGAFSLIVPGSGELYSESYLKSAIFIAIEAAAIIVAVNYDGKGDDQTTSFENYANANWSVNKYAEYVDQIQQEKLKGDYIQIFDQNNNVMWSNLNAVEEKYNIGSHKLDPYGTQQYYEMIGKYNQFHAGWVLDGVSETEATSRVLYYENERHKANDYYSVAATFVKIIVANHFISALDAAWTASRFNKNISLSLKINQENFAYRNEISPRLNISYAF
jgi:hypothetical protein